MMGIDELFDHTFYYFYRIQIILSDKKAINSLAKRYIDNIQSE